MKPLVNAFMYATLTWIASCALAATSVLFIGNSFTYGHG